MRGGETRGETVVYTSQELTRHKAGGAQGKEK